MPYYIFLQLRCFRLFVQFPTSYRGLLWHQTVLTSSGFGARPYTLRV